MPIIRRRSHAPPEGPVSSADFEVAASDGWTRALEQDPAPDGDVVVSLARWTSDRAALLGHSGRLGVRLPNDAALDAIAADLERFARIELEFPKFTDGRSYTLARRLREVHRYTGELVAVGDVLRDQLLYMHRCGFSAFELAGGQDTTAALAAFDEASVQYQAAADTGLPLWKRTSRTPG